MSDLAGELVGHKDASGEGAGGELPSLACMTADTTSVDSCLYSTVACFDPVGTCEPLEEGKVLEWENGARVVLVGEAPWLTGMYYNSSGTACYELKEFALGWKEVRDAESGETYLFSMAELDCVDILCPDGSEERVDAWALGLDLGWEGVQAPLECRGGSQRR
ncbi:MAG: hypothetical protein FJ109_12425 [Deltaproteobacteria bacterium]|nr:hypothetical protein [Deltaproteobacteria bacterium]